MKYPSKFQWEEGGKKAMEALPAVENPTLEEILEADRAAREIVSKEHLA